MSGNNKTKLKKGNAFFNYIHNNILGRIFQTIIVYLVFTILLNFKGPDQSFSLILPVSTGLVVFYLLRDNNLKNSIGNIDYAVFSIIFSILLFILIPPPKINEWYIIFFLQ